MYAIATQFSGVALAGGTCGYLELGCQPCWLGRRLSVAMRHGGAATLSLESAASEPGHLRRGAGFVAENQALWAEVRQAVNHAWRRLRRRTTPVRLRALFLWDGPPLFLAG